MPKAIVQIGDFRRQLRSLGYTMRLRQCSEFLEARVYHDGNQINGGNVLSPTHFEKHKHFYDYIAGISVRDGTFPVIP